MKKNRHFNFRILLFIAVWALSLSITNATVIYVAPSGSAAWTGQIVYNDLTSAITAAATDDEIWIASGTYLIGTGGINYNVAKNLKFYGSFAGTETSIAQRAKVANGEEWEFQNPTIFKMTVGASCIWVNNSGITATFDGLTIDGDNISGTRGIGVNNATEVTISRCIIKNNNTGLANGAGILGTKKIIVDYCWVDHNTSEKLASGAKWGSGICIVAANSSVRNSLISNNSKNGDSGGGIGVDNVAGVVIANCRILQNSTTNSGGGICGYRVDDIHNCYIEGNTASGGGAGIFYRAYSGSGVIYNCIIVGNTATGTGGGLNCSVQSNISNVKVYNCIIANNTGSDAGASFANATTTPAQILNCIFYNNKKTDATVSNIVVAGTNNPFKNNILDNASVTNLTQTNCVIETDAAKLFTDIANGDYTPPTTNFAGEDKGDATGLTFADSKDFAGFARTQGTAIEIGAYEITPSTAVTLKSLKIDGVEIDGFLTGLTDYNVLLDASATAYPNVTVEPTSSTAVVSTLTYSPVTFHTDSVNVVCFTVTNGENSTNYSISFRVDKMPALTHLILTRIREDKLTRDITALETDIDSFLPLMQADGSFTDCLYVSEFRDDGAVLNHLIHLREMAIAYTQTGNKYFESDDIYAKIVKGLEFWYSKHWIDGNWWQNRIAHPQRLGEVFIAMYGGKNDVRTEPIFASLVTRWRSEMGDPDSPNDATTAGANKCDIAMHWIYRGCLTLNEDELAKGADRSFLIIENTTGEGIQHDWSYRQHGAQLYIGGYGYVFVQLVTRQASYLAGTKYALAGDKLNTLSQFVRNTFLPVIRGQRMSFSTLGRGVTRTNNTNQSGTAGILRMLKSVDSAHADEYENAIERVTNVQPASFNVPVSQTHYYRGEYTLQQRPEYTFDVRMASTRMARSEYDIKENKQGFFLSDGATGIFVDGEEYGSILPFWNWKKIPGTTIPDLAVMRRADSYIFSGRSSFAGGVTDGRYGVTGFDMINNQSLFAYNDDDGYGGTPNNSGTRLPALDFGAKKSWFIFDKEIVCLGAGIYSGHDENVLTTINQCRQAGQALVSTNNNVQSIGKGTFTYNNVDWALNDKVAYFFPNKPSLHVSNETKTGSWNDINYNASTDLISGDLFTLWLDQGVRPTASTYAYIIVPNVQTTAEAQAYQSSNIEILANTDSMQVVYHKGLKIYSFAFFKPALFRNSNLTVEAGNPCVMMVKNADLEQMNVWVADPQKQSSPIKIGIKTPLLNEVKAVTYENPASPHQGKSLEFIVNNETAKYEGKDVLLDRSDWTIIASSVGTVDATVAPAGDVPEYIIDGDNVTSFLFVKPGKTYGGTTVAAGAEVSFTIDMKEPNDMTYLVYRHRDYNNTSSFLRITKASFYGKNNEGDAFQPIIENFAVDVNSTENRIDFPEKVSYRYVKFVMQTWDTANGSTIQTSEFNLGNTLQPDDLETGVPVVGESKNDLMLYPNPVKAGQPFYLQSNKNFAGSTISVYTLSGVKVSEIEAKSSQVGLTLDKQGVYLVEVKNGDKIFVFKNVVY